MNGINKVILVGHLGQDPELRYMPSGGGVANMSLATTSTWKDKQSGEKQERTEWHRCIAFNRLAEICGEYLHKGSLVYFEGELRTRKWQDKEGKDRWTTEIVVNEMQMLGPKKPGEGAADRAAGERERKPKPAPAASEPKQADGFDDDDIPF